MSHSEWEIEESQTVPAAITDWEAASSTWWHEMRPFILSEPLSLDSANDGFRWIGQVAPDRFDDKVIEACVEVLSACLPLAELASSLGVDGTVARRLHAALSCSYTPNLETAKMIRTVSFVAMEVRARLRTSPRAEMKAAVPADGHQAANHTAPEQASATQQEANEQTVPSVDWAVHRARLVEEGDREGAALLDRILSRPANFERALDSKILEALANRRHLREVRCELQLCIDADASTPVAACARWTALAGWVRRMAVIEGGREIINFGIKDGSFGPTDAAQMYPLTPGELPAPEIAWAEAFLHATRSIVPFVLDEDLDDQAVQRLVRDMEEVLEGKRVDVTGSVRAVDLIVRTLLGRVTRGLTAGNGESAPPSQSDPASLCAQGQAATVRMADGGGAFAAAAGPGPLVTGEQAAKAIGVGPETLSRWRSRIPAWASQDNKMFRHLMERDGQRYFRDRVLRLSNWFKASRSNGGQKPTPFP